RDGHVTGVQTCALPICHLSGQRNLGLRLAFRFRSAHSMRTGTQLARAAVRMTWSTLSEHPLALLELPLRQISCPVFVGWCREVFIPCARESKPAFLQSAIFLM